MTLADVKAGQRVRVLKIGGHGELRQRLLAMGLITDTVLKVERYAPLLDPIQIKFKGCSLALRVSEGKLIEVEPVWPA